MSPARSTLIQPCDMSKFESDGYLLLDVTPDVQSIIDFVFAAGFEFFRQSMEFKLGHTSASPYDGYKEIGYSFSADSDRPDLAESYCVKSRREFQAKSAKRKNLSILRTRMMSCFYVLDNLVRDLTAEMETHFSGVRSRRHQLTFQRRSHLQLNYYCAQTSSRELLQDLHEDGTFATLTIATAAGLEIKTKNGLLAVPSITRNGVLCMPGDILGLMTGQRIPALYHQVRRLPEPVERLSLMYFASPYAEPGWNIKPWIKNKTNEGINITERIVSNPTRFGLASLDQA